jgi:predicted HicB family RNase H-like nuclease
MGTYGQIPLTVRIEASIEAELRRIADARGVSLSALVREALRREIARARRDDQEAA